MHEILMWLSTGDTSVESWRRLLIHPEWFGSNFFCSGFLFCFIHTKPLTSDILSGRSWRLGAGLALTAKLWCSPVEDQSFHRMPVSVQIIL